MAFDFLNGSAFCQMLQNASAYHSGKTGIRAVIEMYECVLIILATGFVAILLAVMFSYIRKVIYKDEDHLDTSFDAGGNVNAGLTATTVVSQWTWAATLLQSSAVAAKYGISGSIWYASGATIQILLFSMLSVQLKTRAPGAKTFLQVIRARFGKRTHIVFCSFALATNVIVTAMLMLGGSAVITSLVRLISVEYATTLIAAIIGGYTFIGGLGATFYVSYFNTAVIYIVMIILIFKVYEAGEDDPGNPLGTVERVFNYVSCAKGPSGNQDFSYLTILSDEGLMFGLINIVGNFGTVFVDQSYWQSSVAAKPKQGVVGFILGGLAWFAIPFSLSTTMGLAYVALSAEQGQGLLTPDDVNAGLVPPAVAYNLLGKSGAIMVLAMVLMAVTSTGSAEVMAVTSIVVYDIYAIYLKPYRHTTDINSCILCGKGRGRMANPRDKCVCVSMTYCPRCHQDTKTREESRRAIKPDYRCSVHGSYRVYNDYLSHLKNWALVWATMAIIPLTIFLYMIQVSLGWVYMFMGILVGSAVIPITLTMFWERLTGVGMMVGSISGMVLALIVWMCVTATREGGLSNWWDSSGDEVSMLCGNLVAILGGGAITVIVSFLTNKDYDGSMGSEIWETTRDVDNPLSPWMEKYEKELHLTGTQRLDNRPSLKDVQGAFKRAYTLAYSLSTIFATILVFIWPAAMVGVGVMTLQYFVGWVKLSEVWALVAMLLMIILPLINESYDIWSQFVKKNKVNSGADLDMTDCEGYPRGKQSIHSMKAEPGMSRPKSSMNSPDHQHNKGKQEIFQTSTSVSANGDFIHKQDQQEALGNTADLNGFPSNGSQQQINHSGLHSGDHHTQEQDSSSKPTSTESVRSSGQRQSVGSQHSLMSHTNTSAQWTADTKKSPAYAGQVYSHNINNASTATLTSSRHTLNGKDSGANNATFIRSEDMPESDMKQGSVGDFINSDFSDVVTPKVVVSPVKQNKTDRNFDDLELDEPLF